MENEILKLQQQLADQQKMASLGLLSAGIAHEIQNPLNFVINFSKMSDKLLKDLQEVVADITDAVADGQKPSQDDMVDLEDITADLKENMQKIQEHGERAISIIRGILLLSRGKEGEQLPTDIEHTLHEYVWLSYHAMRALDKSFNVTIRENYQEGMPRVMIVPQDLSRAVLNIANNAFYAVHDRWQKGQEGYTPEFCIDVTYTSGKLLIILKDNGCGMPAEVQEKLFKQIITTKPVGKGTGLGMSITHDLIVNHLGGQIEFESQEGVGTTFKICVPCKEC